MRKYRQLIEPIETAKVLYIDDFLKLPERSKVNTYPERHNDGF